MDQSEKNALIALPISLLFAAGLAWAGSADEHQAFGIPLFAGCVALSIFIQWLAFVPAYIQQTEKFYDLVGTLTFLSLLATVLWMGPRPDGRAIILMSLIAIWSIRLGSFLFKRIHQDGSDQRFKEIKPSFLRFLLAWTLQGLWVSFSMAAALAAMTSSLRVEISFFAGAGLVLWLTGFGFEVVADYQKRQFRKRPENKGRFIDTGLWAWSRHPNYFGEILLWLGIAVIAFPALQGWQYVTLISPVFIALLLTRVSGIPLLEARADKQWGGQADYEAYKARTPVLLPGRPSGK